jgi:hypothetical protein
MAARKKSAAARPWDPSVVPPPEKAPSAEERERREFHATHFTADPRGTKPGRTPDASRKVRGGAPSDGPDSTHSSEAPRPSPRPAPRRKRRGGTEPS